MNKKWSKTKLFLVSGLTIFVGYYGLVWLTGEEKSKPQDQKISVQKSLSNKEASNNFIQQVVDTKKSRPIKNIEEPIDEDDLGFAYAELINSLELAIEEKVACEKTINSYRGNGILGKKFQLVTTDLESVENFLFEESFVNYQETAEAELNYGFFANDFLEAAPNLSEGFKPVYFQYQKVYCNFKLQREFLEGVLGSLPTPLKEKFATLSFAKLCQKFGHTSHPNVQLEYLKELGILIDGDYEDPAFKKFFQGLGKDLEFYRDQIQKNIDEQGMNEADKRHDRESWNRDYLKGFMSFVEENEDFSNELNEKICGKLTKVLEIDQELRKTLP